MNYIEIKLSETKTKKIPEWSVNLIKKLHDNSCDMHMLTLNGVSIMEGNSGDFYNGCHGYYEIPEFRSMTGLTKIMCDILKTKDIDYEVASGEYRYMDY